MEQEGIDIDEESEPEGWPMGLLPVSMRLSNATASTISDLGLITCTPSPSTTSSSVFGSESSTSFCPETSTTLGSLIGIQSSSQFNPMQYGLEGRRARRKGGNRPLCSFLGCGICSQEDSVKLSPSLTHLVDSQGERRQHVSNDSVDADKDEAQRNDEDLSMQDFRMNRKRKIQSARCKRSLSCHPSLTQILPDPILPWSGRGPVGNNRISTFLLGFFGKLS
ncbi:hypothetical protein KP509_26G071300 [Ceratopteris richardii]|uniref:Uncharacterized protein n=1 Tax=Ceratopteris richardii TaxID=49495 RepID=A0A8T2RPJ4_CERRI|nr:hypothetical protein KP509_26G071300 [Ceratopteris richardii]KAH7297485.1 hypothetical protein KP509_26G071300 [Ceratopteris richardii]